MQSLMRDDDEAGVTPSWTIANAFVYYFTSRRTASGYGITQKLAQAKRFVDDVLTFLHAASSSPSGDAILPNSSALLPPDDDRSGIGLDLARSLSAHRRAIAGWILIGCGCAVGAGVR
jgi:hypothetical protein